MDGFVLKDGLKLGVAVSATSIEGKDRRGSWYDWYTKGYIKDSASPYEAILHYECYKEDFDLLNKMGIKYYRFGLEWSRLEPLRGVFNNGEFKHYREMIEYMLSLGITPILTLQRFNLPMWFQNMGGFNFDGCERIFEHYAQRVAYELGDLVNEYITFDEPNLYAVQGYFYGAWPPGVRSVKAMQNVIRNIAACHIAAYKAIHHAYEAKYLADVMVGCSVNMRVFVPKDEKSSYQRRCAKKMEDGYQTFFAEALLTGKANGFMKKLKGIAGPSCDMIALSYYTRSTVGGLSNGVKEGAAVDDLDQEIYPEGIVGCAQKLYAMNNLPIYITSNGVCDNSDGFRIKYICDHLKAICESSLPVSRYYYYSFMDGFEELEGRSARFGLVDVDENLVRSIKPSGEFYSEIIAKCGVTEEMILKYSPCVFYKNSLGESLEGINEMYFDKDKALATKAGEGVVTKVSEYVEAPDSYDEQAARGIFTDENEYAAENAPLDYAPDEISNESENLDVINEAKEAEDVEDVNEEPLQPETSALDVTDGESDDIPENSQEIASESEAVMADIALEMNEEGSEYQNFEALLDSAVAEACEAQSAQGENDDDESKVLINNEDGNKVSMVDYGSILDDILSKEISEYEPHEDYISYDNEEDSLDLMVNEAKAEIEEEPHKEAIEAVIEVNDEAASDDISEESSKTEDVSDEEILLDDDDYIDMFLS